jgi:hypothetical protein
MAISVVVAVGDAADPLVGAIKDRLPKVKVGDGSIRPRRWGRSSRESTATRSRRTSIRAGAGRDARRRRSRDRARQRRLLPRRLAPRRRHAGDGRVPRRDLRAGAVGRPRRHLRRGLRLVNDNPYGNGVAIFTRDGGVARQFQFDVNVGMVGSTCRSRSRRVLLVRRLEEQPLRRPAHLRPGGHRLLHADEGGHEPLAGPGHEQRRPRFPADPLTGAREDP